MAERPENRSLGELLYTLVGDLSNLLLTQSQLVRAELSEKSEQLKRSAVSMFASVAFMTAALVVLLQTLILAMNQSGMDPIWAGVVVGVGAVIAGIACFMSAAHTTKASDLMPDRTVNQVQKDGQLLKDQLQ